MNLDHEAKQTFIAVHGLGSSCDAAFPLLFYLLLCVAHRNALINIVLAQLKKKLQIFHIFENEKKEHVPE